MAPWLRAGPYQTENAAMHAPVVHPFHAMQPTDRPNFVCTVPIPKENKTNKQKKGGGKGKKLP